MESDSVRAGPLWGGGGGTRGQYAPPSRKGVASLTKAIGFYFLVSYLSYNLGAREQI